ncbi:cation channel family protein, putative (macronuclear) [Tetrahymena thermophila SB210]|uniref:Cation channel family protein, putative n=1 Tax=Tetrahymena thermophila (strain SB210) TaxID=312017 RepID=W7XJ51_TETTS|nr:cation channel family protein, putative [Tetrahymena thermophila SB210]EWS73859.1 cation channel family protein, putative [Tetrahymena thermophila SB210]|eukprot:XP_012653606.1 cation channel family protein, putative [Tetrahymena thermophila SB210]
MLRVLFMIKVLTFYDIIEKFTESVQFSPKYNLCIKLATLLVEVIILCHLFACIWYSLGYYQESYGIYQNWLRSQNLQDQLVRTKYISSLYFSVITIGTIGYGDILPQNEIERGVLACMAIMACGIFAYILSNIQNVYRKYNQKQKAYIKSLTDLNNFMTNRSVNPILQQMARKYLKYIHDQNFRKGEVPCESLNVLSKHLREEITSEIFNKTINQIKFFKQFSQQFKQQLAQRMTEYTYGPDEIIFKMNSQQEPQIIFILKGSIEISIDQGKYFKYNKEKQKEPFHVCKPNQTLGEYEFVSQSQVSSFNARSIGITTTHQLKLSEFLEILKQYSNDRETYQQLKDSINLYERYSICNINCYSCKSSKHLTNECPIFFYKPNKQRIINLESRDQEDYIKNFHRSKNRLKFSSLLYQNGIAITSLAFQQENQDEMCFFTSMKSLEDYQDDKKNFLQQTKSQKLISNCDEGALENISSQEILAPKRDQDFKIQTETSTSQLNLKDNLSEIKISFLELQQVDKSQNKSQFMSIHKKFKDIDENIKLYSSNKLDEEKSDITLKLFDARKKVHKKKTNFTSQQYHFQTKHFKNQSDQKEELQEDDLITETMRSYTRYMIHNNIEVILRKIRIQGFKAKEKTKKINFTKC